MTDMHPAPTVLAALRTFRRPVFEDYALSFVSAVLTVVLLGNAVDFRVQPAALVFMFLVGGLGPLLARCGRRAPAHYVLAFYMVGATVLAGLTLAVVRVMLSSIS